MKAIKTFTVEHDWGGIHHSGICRWIGNTLQIELTEPFDRIVGTAHYDILKMKLNDANVIEKAKDELELFFMDFIHVIKAQERYRELVKRYHSYRHKITRRNAALARKMALLERTYSKHEISRKEYRMQNQLLLESIWASDRDIELFTNHLYREYSELTPISPLYVSQLLNWIDRNPDKARLLKEHDDKELEQINKQLKEEE